MSRDDHGNPGWVRGSWEGLGDAAPALLVPRGSLRVFTLLSAHFRDLLGKRQDSGSQEHSRAGLLAPFMSAPEKPWHLWFKIPESLTSPHPPLLFL